MKKSWAKALLKAAAATAIAVVMFLGTGKDVKAYSENSLAEFAAAKGLPQWQVLLDTELYKEYLQYAYTDAEIAEMRATRDAFLNGGNAFLIITSYHKEMLDLVNADRAAYGAGALDWNSDLEAIANRRAYEIMRNAQTTEYINAVNANDYNAQCAIVHYGMVTGTAENALVSSYYGIKAATANAGWIASEGHHVVRVDKNYTQYACASYIDPQTGMETWVEVFGTGARTAGQLVFDHVRYMQENPDVAAVFGQDNTALYNHYITYGIAEGRRAYYTNGVPIR